MSMEVPPQRGAVSAGEQPLRTPIVIQTQGPGARLRNWLLYLVLTISLLANVSMYQTYKEYFASEDGPTEKYHSGDKDADDKLAIVRVSGTIMPPFTGRILKTIDHIARDSKVKGVLLAVDSPGGLVNDSHQIYHRLKQLREKHKKPIVVSMGGLAASGGYYISMGAGPEAKIFAEPTTWTGSIGVIIPHYDISTLAEKAGIRSLPLKTGEFKDTLSPFRTMTERERGVWENILNQAFEEFLDVISEGRARLDKDQIRELATGQIYTAKDAKASGLIDEIGYEEDALASLKETCGLTKARVVTYQHATSVIDLLLGSAEARDPLVQWRTLLESTVPRAMYFCSWAPPAIFPGESRLLAP